MLLPEESCRGVDSTNSRSLEVGPLFSRLAEDFLYSGTSALFLLMTNLFPGYWYFSFIALIPVLWKISRASSKECFCLGFLLGLTFLSFCNPETFFSAPISTIVKISCGTILFALWGWAAGLIRQYFGFSPIIVSGLWVFFELALIRLGYISGILASSIPSTPFFLRLATLFGLGIISFIVVLLDSLLIKAIEYAAKTLKARILGFSISEQSWDFAETCRLFSERFYFIPQLRGPPVQSF